MSTSNPLLVGEVSLAFAGKWEAIGWTMVSLQGTNQPQHQSQWAPKIGSEYEGKREPFQENPCSKKLFQFD